MLRERVEVMPPELIEKQNIRIMAAIVVQRLEMDFEKSKNVLALKKKRGKASTKFIKIST